MGKAFIGRVVVGIIVDSHFRIGEDDSKCIIKQPWAKGDSHGSANGFSTMSLYTSTTCLHMVTRLCKLVNAHFLNETIFGFVSANWYEAKWPTLLYSFMPFILIFLPNYHLHQGPH